MEKEEKIILLILGAAIVYLLVKNGQRNTTIKNLTAAASPVVNTAVTLLPGQMDTTIGVLSPSTLTYDKFVQLLQDNNNILATYANAPNGFMLSNASRATDYLNEIGWLDVFNQYEAMLPAEKISDAVIFALNLRGDFALIPPPTTSATPPAPLCAMKNT